MNIIGNFFLAAATIIFLVLCKISLFTKMPDSDTQRQLREIEAADKMEIMGLLYYVHPYHPNQVRKKAMAKIKSRSDWQQELVRNLKSEKAADVFSFLAYNDVKDETLFSEALRQGILIQARLLREDIRNCPDVNSLKAGWYSQTVEDVLHTLDKFESKGVDFRPTLQELGNALDEPTSFARQELQAKSMLNEWLKKH